MTQLLHISASARGAASDSRRAGQMMAEQLAAAIPDLSLCRRDLAAAPLPHPDGAFVTAALMPDDERSDAENAALALSETLIGELETADLVLIDTPMHNFTVPSALKAWIDYIVRIRRTFGITPEGKVGFLADRPVVVLVACGGRFDHAPGAQSDFLTPYLSYVLASVGLRDVEILRLEGMRRTPEQRLQQFAAAERWIAERVAAIRDGRDRTP
jgi:FMN-dependent NADH-azoreductase